MFGSRADSAWTLCEEISVKNSFSSGLTYSKCAPEYWLWRTENQLMAALRTDVYSIWMLLFRYILRITKWDCVYSQTQICFELRNQQKYANKNGYLSWTLNWSFCELLLSRRMAVWVLRNSHHNISVWFLHYLIKFNHCNKDVILKIVLTFPGQLQ